MITLRRRTREKIMVLNFVNVSASKYNGSVALDYFKSINTENTADNFLCAVVDLGTQRMQPLPGQNFFISMQFLGETGQIVGSLRHWCTVLKILDPPCLWILFLRILWSFCKSLPFPTFVYPSSTGNPRSTIKEHFFPFWKFLLFSLK